MSTGAPPTAVDGVATTAAAHTSTLLPACQAHGLHQRPPSNREFTSVYDAFFADTQEHHSSTSSLISPCILDNTYTSSLVATEATTAADAGAGVVKRLPHDVLKSTDSSSTVLPSVDNASYEVWTDLYDREFSYTSSSPTLLLPPVQTFSRCEGDASMVTRMRATVTCARSMDLYNSEVSNHQEQPLMNEVRHIRSFSEESSSSPVSCTSSPKGIRESDSALIPFPAIDLCSRCKGSQSEESRCDDGTIDATRILLSWWDGRCQGSSVVDMAHLSANHSSATQSDPRTGGAGPAVRPPRMTAGPIDRVESDVSFWPYAGRSGDLDGGRGDDDPSKKMLVGAGTLPRPESAQHIFVPFVDQDREELNLLNPSAVAAAGVSWDPHKRAGEIQQRSLSQETVMGEVEGDVYGDIEGPVRSATASAGTPLPMVSSGAADDGSDAFSRFSRCSSYPHVAGSDPQAVVETSSPAVTVAAGKSTSTPHRFEAAISTVADLLLTRPLTSSCFPSYNLLEMYRVVGAGGSSRQLTPLSPLTAPHHRNSDTPALPQVSSWIGKGGLPKQPRPQNDRITDVDEGVKGRDEAVSLHKISPKAIFLHVSEGAKDLVELPPAFSLLPSLSSGKGSCITPVSDENYCIAHPKIPHLAGQHAGHGGEVQLVHLPAVLRGRSAAALPPILSSSSLQLQLYGRSVSGVTEMFHGGTGDEDGAVVSQPSGRKTEANALSQNENPRSALANASYRGSAVTLDTGTCVGAINTSHRAAQRPSGFSTGPGGYGDTGSGAGRDARASSPSKQQAQSLNNVSGDPPDTPNSTVVTTESTHRHRSDVRCGAEVLLSSEDDVDYSAQSVPQPPMGHLETVSANCGGPCSLSDAVRHEDGNEKLNLSVSTLGSARSSTPSSFSSFGDSTTTPAHRKPHRGSKRIAGAAGCCALNDVSRTHRFQESRSALTEQERAVMAVFLVNGQGQPLCMTPAGEDSDKEACRNASYAFTPTTDDRMESLSHVEEEEEDGGDDHEFETSSMLLSDTSDSESNEWSEGSSDIVSCTTMESSVSEKTELESPCYNGLAVEGSSEADGEAAQHHPRRFALCLQGATSCLTLSHALSPAPRLLTSVYVPSRRLRPGRQAAFGHLSTMRIRRKVGVLLPRRLCISKKASERMRRDTTRILLVESHECGRGRPDSRLCRSRRHSNSAGARRFPQETGVVESIKPEDRLFREKDTVTSSLEDATGLYQSHRIAAFHNEQDLCLQGWMREVPRRLDSLVAPLERSFRLLERENLGVEEASLLRVKPSSLPPSSWHPSSINSARWFAYVVNETQWVDSPELSPDGSDDGTPSLPPSLLSENLGDSHGA